MEGHVSSSLERLARNQTIFRELNERIQELADPDQAIRFVCECSHVGCEATVQLNTPEYESVRSEPTHFVVASGHNLPEIERVVGLTDGYAIVEKMIGREFSKASDPRSDT
jgi:hypothetical protein